MYIDKKWKIVVWFLLLLPFNTCIAQDVDLSGITTRELALLFDRETTPLDTFSVLFREYSDCSNAIKGAVMSWVLKHTDCSNNEDISFFLKNIGSDFFQYDDNQLCKVILNTLPKGYNVQRQLKAPLINGSYLFQGYRTKESPVDIWREDLELSYNTVEIQKGLYMEYPTIRGHFTYGEIEQELFHKMYLRFNKSNINALHVGYNPLGVIRNTVDTTNPEQKIKSLFLLVDTFLLFDRYDIMVPLLDEVAFTILTDNQINDSVRVAWMLLCAKVLCSGPYQVIAPKATEFFNYAKGMLNDRSSTIGFNNASTLLHKIRVIEAEFLKSIPGISAKRNARFILELETSYLNTINCPNLDHNWKLASSYIQELEEECFYDETISRMSSAQELAALVKLAHIGGHRKSPINSKHAQYYQLKGLTLINMLLKDYNQVLRFGYMAVETICNNSQLYDSEYAKLLLSIAAAHKQLGQKKVYNKWMDQIKIPTQFPTDLYVKYNFYHGPLLEGKFSRVTKPIQRPKIQTPFDINWERYMFYRLYGHLNDKSRHFYNQLIRNNLVERARFAAKFGWYRRAYVLMTIRDSFHEPYDNWSFEEGIRMVASPSQMFAEILGKENSMTELNDSISDLKNKLIGIESELDLKQQSLLILERLKLGMQNENDQLLKIRDSITEQLRLEVYKLDSVIDRLGTTEKLAQDLDSANQALELAILESQRAKAEAEKSRNLAFGLAIVALVLALTAIYLLLRRIRLTARLNLLLETNKQLSHIGKSVTGSIKSGLRSSLKNFEVSNQPEITFQLGRVSELGTILEKMHDYSNPKKEEKLHYNLQLESELIRRIVDLKFKEKSNQNSPSNAISVKSHTKPSKVKVPQFALLNLVFNSFEHGNLSSIPNAKSKVTVQKGRFWNHYEISDNGMAKISKNKESSNSGIKYVKRVARSWNWFLPIKKFVHRPSEHGYMVQFNLLRHR